MKIAYFLNNSNTVVNSIECDDNVETSFLNSVLSLDAFSEASTYIVVDEENTKPYIGIGATYDGIRFTPKIIEEEGVVKKWSFSSEEWILKPFNSWLWNTELEIWEAPISKPEGDYVWDEETQSWLLAVPLIEIPPSEENAKLFGN